MYAVDFIIKKLELFLIQLDGVYVTNGTLISLIFC